MKRELIFISVQSEPAYRGQFLQHIQDLYNLRLEDAVTGQQLKETLLNKFKDNDDLISAVDEWIEFNIEENKDWLSLTVIPSPKDVGDEQHFMVMDMIRVK